MDLLHRGTLIHDALDKLWPELVATMISKIIALDVASSEQLIGSHIVEGFENYNIGIGWAVRNSRIVAQAKEIVIELSNDSNHTVSSTHRIYVDVAGTDFDSDKKDLSEHHKYSTNVPTLTMANGKLMLDAISKLITDDGSYIVVGNVLIF